MNGIKRITAFLLVVATIVVTAVLSMLSAGAVYYFYGNKMIVDSGYKYYRAWSQDQFPWHNTKPSDAYESDWMNKYGCSTVAMAKMFVEAGVANPSNVNPGTLMNKYGSPSKGIGDIGIYWSTLAGQFGMVCESFQKYPDGNFYNTAMNYFRKSDHQYHLLLKVTLAGGGSHYVQVDRQATIKEKEIIYNDSTNTSDGGTRYNSASAYYNAISLKKLSKATFRPDFFVVFYNDDKVTLKSLTEKSSTSATLSWYPNGACDKYIVYKRKKGENTWTNKHKYKFVVSLKGEGVRNFTDTSLSPGDTYEYTVRGYYVVNNKPVYLKYDTKGKSVTTKTDAPKLKSAESVDHKTIKVSWDKVRNADGYRAFRKKPTDKKFQEIGDTTSTSYTDTNAQCGQDYYYTVRAYVNTKSNMGKYDGKGIKGKALPKKVPLKNTESLDFNAIKVSWERVEGVSGYAVYRKAGTKECFKQIAEIPGNKNTSTTDLSAVTGTKYLYTVRAYKVINGVKYLGDYNIAGVSGTAYTKATKIKSAVSNRADTLTLYWDKINGASGYNVYRKGESDKAYKCISTISGNGNTIFTDKKLKCCEKYLYRVCGYKTVNKKNYQGYSSSVYTGLTNPEQPSLKSAVSTSYNSIKIDWIKTDQSTGYEVYRKTTGKYEKKATVKGNSSVSFTDKNAVTGVRYQYTVKAVCEKKGIKRSSSYNKYIHATAYPSNPVVKSVTSQDYNAVKVQWKPVEGATSYAVYRKPHSEKSYREIVKIGSGATEEYIDRGVVCGTNYDYVVRAIRYEGGREYYSGHNKELSCKPLPKAPNIKVENYKFNTLSVSWNKVNGADGYRVYYKRDGQKKWSVLSTFGNGNLTSCYHGSLTTGTKYIYTVKAYHTEGKTKYWGEYNKTGVSNTPLTNAPKLEYVKATSYNSVGVKWKSVEGASGYKVYRKTESDKVWQLISTLSGNNSTSYRDTKLSCGRRYSYTVKSYKKVGNTVYSGYYDQKGLSATPIPETPTVSLFSENYNKINVSWKKCGGANGYKIYRKVQGGTYQLVKKINSQNTVTYRDTVECGVEYVYYVTAYVTVNKIDYGSFDSDTRSCKAVPLTPKMISAVSNEKNKAKISWEKVSGASGYYIYRKDSDSGYKLIYDLKSSSANNYVDETAKSGEAYTYTVKAYRICTAGYISGSYDNTGLTVKVK